MEIGLPGGTVRPPVRSFAERDLCWVGLRATKRPGGPPDYGIGTWDASSWGMDRSEVGVGRIVGAASGYGCCRESVAVLTWGKRKAGELLAPAAQLSTGAEKVNHLCSFHIERLMHWCARRGEGCLCEE